MRQPHRPADVSGTNRFSNEPDSTLATVAASAAGVLAQNPDYHVPAATTQALAHAGTTFSTYIDAAKTARDAAKAATTAKDDWRNATIAALNAVGAVVYNNSTSDSMLQALGFSPRAATSRPTMPLTVAGLSAATLGDGVVRLDWKRNGNRASAIFQVERSLDGGATWTMVAATGQAKASLAGYAPGVPVWFRVSTTNSVGTSLPSGVVGAYVGEIEASAPVALKLAA